MGPIRNPRWEQKWTEGYAIVSIVYRVRDSNEDYDSHPSGVIHSIVRSGSQDEQNSTPEQNDTSTGEESSEDHNEVIVVRSFLAPLR
jgi:hypothetical protein